MTVQQQQPLQQQQQQPRRRMMPKLVYHFLSDKELRKELKKLGLSSSGSKDALIKRHKR